MGEAAAATSIFGSIQPFDDDEPPLVRIADHGGDVILAVTFETSEATLRRARKWAPRKSSGTSAAAEPSIVLKPRFTVAYRVSLNALTKQSKYFANLLGNSAFKEAQLIAETYASLSRQGIKPADAEAADLPVIRVTDDDDATRAAGREVLFEDMLRLMHQMPIKNSALVNMPYATTLAILADRFDCTSRVSRAFADIRFKWPVTSNRPYVDEAGRATEVERVLRQKVLTAWLLNQPMQLHQASRELLMRGSRFWGPSAEEHNMTGAWWNLPEGIEDEFQCRRERILNTIASIQKHFLGLYSSRIRQCRLGYDSSAACDHFQLGQMLKFLLSKGLVSLVDYSPASMYNLPSDVPVDIKELLNTLKECPNYQLDKHHVNCGLKIRIDPILDYVKTMLSANHVAISRQDWTRRRDDATWAGASRGGIRDGEADDDDGRKRVFAFTRALANDERLRYEGHFYVNRMARNLFTADTWDWTPEF